MRNKIKICFVFLFGINKIERESDIKKEVQQNNDKLWRAIFFRRMKNTALFYYIENVFGVSYIIKAKKL